MVPRRSDGSAFALLTPPVSHFLPVEEFDMKQLQKSYEKYLEFRITAYFIMVVFAGRSVAVGWAGGRAGAAAALTMYKPPETFIRAVRAQEVKIYGLGGLPSCSGLSNCLNLI